MKSLFGGYESVLLFVLRRKNVFEMRVMEKERGVERIYSIGKLRWAAVCFPNTSRLDNNGSAIEKHRGFVVQGYCESLESSKLLNYLDFVSKRKKKRKLSFAQSF